LKEELDDAKEAYEQLKQETLRLESGLVTKQHAEEDLELIKQEI